MKKHCRLNCITALVLALSLVFAGCVSAFADEDDGAIAIGNNVEGSEYLKVDARPEGSSSTPVVYYETDECNGERVPNGSFLSAGDLSDHVEITAVDGGQVTVSAGSVINPEADPAVNIHSGDEDSYAQFFTPGNITAGGTAVDIEAADGGQAFVMAYGDLAGATGIQAETRSDASCDEGTEIQAYVYGDIDADSAAIDAGTSEANSSILICAGDIIAGNTGIWALTGKYNTADSSSIEIHTSDIKTDDGFGIFAQTGYAYDANSSSIEIYTGDIKTDDGWGIYAVAGSYYGTEANSSSINICAGDIEVDDGHGVNAEAYGESSSVNVSAGDISGELSGITAVAQTDGAEVFVSAGDVSSGESEAVYAGAFGEGAYAGVVANDITSAYGTGTMLAADDGGFAYVVADGTISGGETSIVLFDGTDPDSVQVVAWKVEANDAGHLVETNDWLNRELVYDEAAQAVEKNILYIIKVEQPKAGGKLKAVNEAGERVEVALEGEKVLLKVDVKSGYKLNGAYNGKGKKLPLVKDAAGNYYVVVEKGGGVYLSASISKIRKAAVPLVTLKDESGKIELSFFPNGTFSSKMEDGSKEMGRFEKDENGRLVLVDAGGNRIVIGEDGTFTYTSAADPSLSYSFVMTEADRETLLNALK